MSSHNQIFKSTGIIAFVSIIQMIFGLVRNKAIAIMLGTKGFGLYGMYQTFIELSISLSSLGLEKSGVRQIAKNKNDIEKVQKVISIFRLAIIVLTLIFSCITFIFSSNISYWLFNSEEYSFGVKICAGAILFRTISQSQVSILTGFRELKSLALSQIYGSIIGSLCAIVTVYLIGINGLTLSFLVLGITTFLFTWFFVRKLDLKFVYVSLNDFKSELLTLLKLGLGFTLSAIIASSVIYFIRVYLADHYSFEIVGIYQSSWLISNMYIGIILTAMGVDFMPRLMTVIDNNEQVNELVNEQLEVGVLLSSLGIALIILFSPILFNILYTGEFSSGVSILKWQILGVGMRVVGVPLSHSVMAKNKPFSYTLIMFLFAISEYVLLVVFSNIYGFDGLGMNYFFAYIFFLSMWIVVCKRLYGFHFKKKTINVIIVSWMFIFCVWINSYYNPNEYLKWGLGIIFLIVNFIWFKNYINKSMGISLVQLLKRKR